LAGSAPFQLHQDATPEVRDQQIDAVQTLVRNNCRLFSTLRKGERVEDPDILETIDFTLRVFDRLPLNAFEDYGHAVPQPGDIVMVIKTNVYEEEDSVGMVVKREAQHSLVLFPNGSTTQQKKVKTSLLVLPISRDRGN